MSVAGLNWLTARQLKFIEHYLISENGQQAAIAAGYSPATAAPAASRLLRHPKVIERMRRAESEVRTQIDTEVAGHIENIYREPENKTIADRTERLRFWTSIVRSETKIRLADRLAASQLLGKAQGDFVDQVQVQQQIVIVVATQDDADALNDCG